MKKDKTMKKGKAMKKGTTTPTFIQSLRDELLLELLTKVTACSFHSLYSAKMVCKKFNQLAQHDHIFEHISIQRFERVDLLTSRRRHEEMYKFLERCREFNNLEALYTQRMRWYFKYNNFELRIESLKTKISKGCQASTYVYSAILVC
ncbi:F-box protein [Pyrus ussuriensis x Pyrus communis]|uniref:F-box protein n=1 Tax=Pyrus ussuriensis x Pyrus communis TaxID=2448454 RepID=A0A5N5HJD8_9ROSA|nr:F-box protein [Pyrus ussuriensis x Pyrus communis]